MINKIRHPVLMLIAATAVGLFSGKADYSHFGLRGALFGFALTISVLLMRRLKQTWLSILPGILLGILLGFIHPAPEKTFDYITFINCTLFVPIYAYCYQRPKFWSMLWRLLLAGILCTAFRAVTGNFEFFNLLFIKGTLFFLSMWLVAMWMTDPRFNRNKKEST